MGISYPLGEVNEITIESETEERLLHETVRNTNDTKDVHLVLTRGADTRDNPGENRSELHRSDDHSGTCQIFATENEAIAYVLGSLETYGYGEKEAYRLLKEAGLDLAAYDEYWQGMGRKERARLCISDSKERMRTIGSPLDRAIFSNPTDVDYEPSWRSIDPSEEAVEIAHGLKLKTVNSQSCYKTAYQALQKINDENISYCEGLAIPKHPGRASTHAWIEIDGEVIELTWPWNGPCPHEKAVYYGGSIPNQNVREVHERRPTFSSVLLPDEVYFEYGDVKQAIAESMAEGTPTN